MSRGQYQVMIIIMIMIIMIMIIIMYQILYYPELATAHKVDIKYNGLTVADSPIVLHAKNPGDDSDDDDDDDSDDDASDNSPIVLHANNPISFK